MPDDILIPKFQTGIDTDSSPWQAPPDSFEDLNNFHVRHGNIQKRSGYRIFGQMRHNPGPTPVTNRIMGIFRYYEPSGAKQTLIFDTKRAAIFNGTTNLFDPLDAADIMSGGEFDYIWAQNWQHSSATNRMYFSNGLAYDGAALNGIRYYDETVSTINTTLFIPSLGGTRILYGAKLIFALKQRLLVLNVHERDTGAGTTKNFPQRVRWCQAQKPSNWNDITAGGGGFVDAPTGEHIISARALQDVIIVFFTNSVWTLRPVGDPALPFKWDKINDFRACDGKMASIAYDKYVVGLGVRGITATNGMETARIDHNIESFTNDEINTEKFQKVYGSRNFNNLRMWVLYPNLESDENNKSLIRDDESSAFSKYNISMNCLGYGNISSDLTLADFTLANNLDFNLIEVGENTIQGYFYQGDGEIFLGGDIGGFVYILQTGSTDNGSAINCDLFTNAWNPYQEKGAEAQLHYIDIYCDTDKSTKLVVRFFKDTERTEYTESTINLLPPLDYISAISNITQANPAQVTSNKHGISTGDIIYIYGVEGMVEINNGYIVTVIDGNNFTLKDITTLVDVDSTAFTAYTTGGEIFRREYYRTKVWKRIFAGGIGFQHRMSINNSGINDNILIHGFKPVFKPIKGRLIN